MSGMAMFVGSSFSNMEAAFGRLHNSEAGVFGARPIIVESITLNSEAASIAIPNIHSQWRPLLELHQ